MCDWNYRKQRSEIDDRIKNFFQTDFKEQSCRSIDHCIHQLEEYFSGERNVFDIPFEMAGTPFQQKVWKELSKIPYGRKISYEELSFRLNNPKAIRAVAHANGSNALSIIIPCHRVIGKSGKLTGYAGGLRAKKELLELESGISNKQYELF